MLHAPGLAPPWPRLTLAVVLDLLGRFCSTTFGIGALDCVQEPPGLRYAPSARARRLIRGAQLSCW